MALEHESRQLAVIERLGDARLHVGAARERHFSHDQTASALVLLEPHGPAVNDSSATGGEIVADAFVADDRAAGRKIRTLDVVHQFQDTHLRLIQQRDARVQHLAQVVGWHAGSEAEPDAILAVDRWRDAGGQVVRFEHPRVLLVGGHHWHGVFADVAQHHLTDAG